MSELTGLSRSLSLSLSLARPLCVCVRACVCVCVCIIFTADVALASRPGQRNASGCERRVVCACEWVCVRRDATRREEGSMSGLLRKLSGRMSEAMDRQNPGSEQVSFRSIVLPLPLHARLFSFRFVSRSKIPSSFYVVLHCVVRFGVCSSLSHFGSVSALTISTSHAACSCAHVRAQPYICAHSACQHLPLVVAIR